MRQGVAPVLPIDDPYDFPFIVGERSILRLPGVTNPTTVYPPPVYALSTVTSEQGPADSGFNAIARTVDGTASEAEETATAETSASIVMTATNVIGSDEFTRKWKAIRRPVGSYSQTFDVPSNVLDQIRTDDSVFSGLHFVQDTSEDPGTGVLLVLDSGRDAVFGIRVTVTGEYSRALDWDIPNTVITAAYRTLFSNINAEVILPTGITHNAATNVVYMLDSVSGHIFSFSNGQHTPDNDIPASAIQSQLDTRIGGEPQGITYDGKDLMVAVAGFGIVAIDPITKTVNAQRNITQAYLQDTPAGITVFITGVSWTGQYLLALDSRTDAIWGLLNGRYDGLHDIATSVLRRANTSISPSGVAYTGILCFVADAFNNNIYAYNFSPTPVERPPASYVETNPEISAPLYDNENVRVTRDSFKAIAPDTRLTAISYDRTANLLYAVDQLGSQVGAFRNGVFLPGYGVTKELMLEAFGDTVAARGFAGPVRGCTVLPQKYDNALLVVHRNPRLGIVGFSKLDLSDPENPKRTLLPKYNLAPTGIQAQSLAYDYNRDLLYVSNQAYRRNIQNTEWVRVPSADITLSPDVVGGFRASTYDGVSMLLGGVGADGNMKVFAYTNGVRTPLFDIENDVLTGFNPTFYLSGLASDGRNIYLADGGFESDPNVPRSGQGGTQSIFAVTREIPPAPNTSVIIYGMSDAPRGLRINPLTRTRVGVPAIGSAQEGIEGTGRYLIKYHANNIEGGDTITQEMTVHPANPGTDPDSEQQLIRYSYSNFPEWAILDTGTLTIMPNPVSPEATLPAGLDEKVTIGTVTATNSVGDQDSLAVEFRVVRGEGATINISVDEAPHPDKVRVQWPLTVAGEPRDITEFLEGCLLSSTKELVLHEDQYNSGPTMRPSFCEIVFQEIDPANAGATGSKQPSLSSRLLSLPPDTSFHVDIYDQFDNIYWTGEVLDNFQVNRGTAINTFTFKVYAENALLNYKEPADDRDYENVYLWHDAANYRSTALYRLLTTELGINVVPPSAEQSPIPDAPLKHVVIPYSGPKRDGHEIWDTVQELLVKSGLIMYPNHTGTQFHIESIADRKSVLDLSGPECTPNSEWNVDRLQNSVKTIIAQYAPTQNFIAVAKRNISEVWSLNRLQVNRLYRENRELPDDRRRGATDAEIISVKPGESWPKDATYYNVVPTQYQPISAAGTGLLEGQENPLDNSTVLRVTGAHLVGVPNGMTIRRAELHGTWADIWLTNDTDRVIALEHLAIHADDVVYIDNNSIAAGENRIEGSPTGKSILRLDNRYVETQENAERLLSHLKSWADSRKFMHRFSYESPDIRIMEYGLRYDYILPANPGADNRGPIVRPIRIVERWDAGANTQQIEVEAESRSQ